MALDCLIVAAVVVVGCGDDLAPTIRVVAEGARWMAVRTSPDGTWTRFDGEDVRFEARGVFDVAVVCREDIGDGFSIRATADDGVLYDEQFCSRTGSLTPQFAVTGAADMIYVGTSASYLPNIVGQPIEPGTYDVIAQRLSSEVPRATDRVQVLRDVVVDGSAPIPIDIERYGLPPARARIDVDGEPAPYASITGWTANGTWFAFSGTGLMTLPVELTRPTDLHIATVYTNDAWAETRIYAGDNDIALPDDSVDAMFSAGSPPALIWRSATAWERVMFQVAQVTTSGPGLPRWRTIAYAGALTPGHDGASTVDIPMPDVTGWRTTWMADPAMPRSFYGSWERARPDGGRGGVHRSEQR